MFGNIKALFRLGKPLEIKEEDQVKLPALFGIKPGVYLSFLYGAMLLFVLFLVLVLPGIVKPGSVGVFASEPSGAAVRVDDVTLGYTPCRIFVSKGKRVVEFILPGFNPDRQELDVRGRLVGSLFVPRKFPVTGSLVCEDPAGTFARSALDYIYWSAAGEPAENYQIPLTLSEGAYRTGPAAKDPAVRETMQGIVENTLRYAASRAAVRDLLRSQMLVDNAGLSPSPLTLVRSMQEAAALLNTSPAAAVYLAELLSADSAEIVAKSAWYYKNAAVYGNGAGNASAGNTRSTIVGTYDLPFRMPGALSLEGVSFTAVDTGYLEKFGRREIMPPMLIAGSPISLDAWNRFTDEVPFWAADNREALVAGGFVEESYLLPVDSSAYPEPTAPGISWYAAADYCNWLNSKIPPALEGWELRLPTEAEWEYAIRQSGQEYGALWEWCADPYAPLSFFPVSPEALEMLEKENGGPRGVFPKMSVSAVRDLTDNSIARTLERTVRGGSWINRPGSVSLDSRGGLPPNTSSPFAGFRPVIVPRQGN